MNSISPHLASSGAAMDQPVPKRRGRRIALFAGAALAATVLGAALWTLIPRGLQVQQRDVRIAAVEQGVFRDDIVVRAQTEPLNSVILDSVESGRVEEVFARDGTLVKKGQLLFRLSNPNRNLELLARQAEHAQQISNLSTLRVAQEASNTDHRRRVADLEFALAQGEKQHARNARLAGQGFISAVSLEESSDRLAQQQRAVRIEREANATEAKVKQDALAQLEVAIRELKSGLTLVGATVDALAVKAPVDGMLTGFRLQVGQTVRTDQHIGRIDDPNRFKLAAQVDEFYLNRVAVGHKGMVKQGETSYQVTVSTIYPQIKDGRFTVELVFAKEQPPVLRAGQSMDAQVTLGEPKPALLLPNGAFVNDSGGTWVFAIGADGQGATRRKVAIGRRNNSQIEILSGLAPGERVIISGYAGFGKAERLQLNQ
ncbi:MAG: efflux RND transporter periplasmic adaptor subunit [Pseudomonadota bacterium]